MRPPLSIPMSRGTPGVSWQAAFSGRRRGAMQHISNRVITGAALVLLGAIVQSTAVAAGDTPAASTVATVPPPSQFQFGGQCVEGLSVGRHVMTNCAITWT